MNNYNIIYILLYQVKKFSEKWIVKYDDNFKKLKNIIKNVNKNEKSIGNYYIIKHIDKNSILDKKFKNFQIYKNEYYDKLMYTK